jgi:hypothetical protein
MIWSMSLVLFVIINEDALVSGTPQLIGGACADRLPRSKESSSLSSGVMI